MSVGFNPRKLHIKGSVAFIKLSNIANANAVTGTMMCDLEKIVCEELDNYNGKAVVLTGDDIRENPAFCAGMFFF